LEAFLLPPDLGTSGNFNLVPARDRLEPAESIDFTGFSISLTLIFLGLIWFVLLFHPLCLLLIILLMLFSN